MIDHQEMLQELQWMEDDFNDWEDDINDWADEARESEYPEYDEPCDWFDYSYYREDWAA